MNPKEFIYEMPIVNLDDDETTLTETISLNETEDQDCTIVEPNVQETSLHRNSNKKSKRLLDSSNDIPIVIDEAEKDNDCAIIDDEISFEDDQTSSNKQLTNVNESIDDAIVLDEDEQENDCSIISTNILSQNNHPKNNTPSRNSYVVNFDDIYRQNRVLAELIEKCLDMENSTGMLRIINRNVIPIYNDICEDFRKSNSFQKLLTKTLRNLEVEPNRKFSHIKKLCEIMKVSVSSSRLSFEGQNESPCENVIKKKRVQLTTVKRKLKGKFSTNKSNFSSRSIPKKKTKVDIINLDDYDDSNAGIQINDVGCRTEETSVLISSVYKHHIEVTNNANNFALHKHSQQYNETDKHLQCNDETNEHKLQSAETNEHNQQNDETSKHEMDDDVVFIKTDDHNSDKENTIVMGVQSENTISHVPYIGCAIKRKNGYIFNPGEVSKSSTNIPFTSEDKKKHKIEEIETKIKMHKKYIEELEAREVNWDDDFSPYIESDLFKARVISLYKELCELTGTDSVKRHKVRLKAVEGRHEGPMRCLEEFINSNIDNEGNPPFPDMLDVIKCVRKANDQYQLSWSKKQIKKEAQDLFIHYGRVAQKRRQKHELRHLMRYVKEEAVDPADTDPALQARLENNAKLAMKNEQDLLDRYAKMEYLNTRSVGNINIVSLESENHSDSDDTSTTLNKTIPDNSAVLNNTALNTNTILSNNTVLDDNTVLSKNTIINANTVSNNNTVPNNNNSITINSHVKSINNQNTENAVIFNQYTQPLIIASDTPNPIRYVVVDDDMKIIGYVASLPNKLLENSKTLRDDIKDASKNINSSNNVANSTVSNINDIQVNTSVQYNDASTNSSVDATIKVVKDKSATENEVLSSSDAARSQTGEKTCDLLADKGTTELTGRTYLVNDTGSVDTASNTCDNNTESETRGKSCELVNNEGPVMSCGFINNAGSSDIGDKTGEVVDDEWSSKATEFIVKKEKLDIPRMLEALGDNYTVSIMNIEDPFEIIDISDSSDSEDDL